MDEVVNGRIPADTPALTLRIPAWSGMSVGDHLEYTWVGTSAGGVESMLHDGFPLMASDIGKAVSFDLNPILAVAPFDGGSAEAWYTVTPASGGADVVSDHATWPVGEEKLLPAPVVEDASDGHIDLAEVGNTFSVDMRWPQMTVNDTVSLYWQGTDADGNAGIEQVAGTHRVTDDDALAGQVVLTLSTATYLAPYEDGSVVLFYTLNRADGSATVQSDTANYEVRPILQTLFEDFEGNMEQEIALGETVKLVNSGASLKNTGNSVIYITGSLTPSPATQGNVLNVFSRPGYAARAQITFPHAFQHIRLGLGNASCTLSFYGKAGNKLDAVEIDPPLEGSMWYTHTLPEDMATRIDVEVNHPMEAFVEVDNITVSTQPMER